MIINGKEIDDDKLAAAKERFERHQKAYHSKGKLTFDQILDRVTIDCNSLSDIARAHGVTRQAMHMAYNHDFRALLPDGRSGRRREKVCALKRVAVAAHDMSDESLLTFIADEAKRFGYTVRRIQANFAKRGNGRPIFFKSRVKVRGKLCLINHLTTAKPTSETSTKKYAKLHLGKNLNYDFRIIVTDFPGHPRKVLILPADILSEKSDFHVPNEKTIAVYNNHRSIVDWWSYENAWHLIKA